MTSTPTRLMTLDEFLELPETKPYTELINGVPEQKPVGKRNHSRAQSRLVILLHGHPRTSEGTAWPELGFKFPRTSTGNLRVPDFSYYLPGNDDGEGDYPERAPDLAVEVRSEGQGMQGQRDRLSFLRGQGTPCTMLVDPEARIIEVVDGDRTWTAGENDEVTLVHLNGFSFKVRELFS